MNTPSFHQEPCQQRVVVFQSVNSMSARGGSPVAAEVKAVWASGCPQSDHPATGREGAARRVAGLSSPGLPVPLHLHPEVPHTAACPRDLPAWKENAGCCGQANTAAVCPGIGAPAWRELTDRTFCRLPALFQNSLVLAGPGCPGVARDREPGTGQGKAGPRGQQHEVSR